MITELIILIIIIYLLLGIRYSGNSVAVIVFFNKVLYERKGFFWFAPVISSYKLFYSGTFNLIQEKVSATTNDYHKVSLSFSAGMKINDFGRYYYLTEKEDALIKVLKNACLTVIGKNSIDECIKNKDKLEVSLKKFVNQKEEAYFECVDFIIFEFDHEKIKKTEKKKATKKKATKKKTTSKKVSKKKTAEKKPLLKKEEESDFLLD